MFTSSIKQSGKNGVHQERLQQVNQGLAGIFTKALAESIPAKNRHSLLDELIKVFVDEPVLALDALKL